MDARKIKDMMDWSLHKNVLILSDFLGLTGQYHRFIKNYGLIVSSLTNMLKNNNFKWIDEARKAFVNF